MVEQALIQATTTKIECATIVFKQKIEILFDCFKVVQFFMTEQLFMLMSIKTHSTGLTASQ